MKPEELGHILPGEEGCFTASGVRVVFVHKKDVADFNNNNNNKETTENSHIGHCTHISESTNVRVQ